MKYHYAVAVFALLDCSGSITLPPIHFAETRAYRHTIPGCDPRVSAGCGMTLNFSTDGSVTIHASDVPTTGRYLISGQGVAIRFRPGDTEYEWSMRLSPDESTLAMVDGDLVLTRLQD